MVHKVASEAEFDSKIAQDKLVVVDYFAVWCGPCKVISPYLDTLQQENPDVDFIKVDVDELETVAAKQGITAMPTFHFYKNGNRLHEFKGANKDALKAAVAQYK